MARIRTIKPSFFTSEVVAELSFRARLTWIGLWTHCDDKGRCKDNTRLIKAALWPLDDDVDLAEVEEDLTTLAENGRIQRYTVAGQGFIQVVGWGHQKINRPTGSDIPAPPPGGPGGSPHGGLTDDAVSNQGEVRTFSANGTNQQVIPLMDGSVSAHGQLTAGSPPERKGKEGKGREEQTPPRSARERDRFADFWAAYPRRTDRLRAEKAWVKAIKTHPPDQIIEAAKRFAESAQKTGADPRFIKYPATWLNAGSYLNEPGELRLVSGGYQGWTNPDPSRYDEDF